MPSKYNKRQTRANFGRSNDFAYESRSESLENKDFVWYDFPFTIGCTIFLVAIHFIFWISAPTDILFTIPTKYVELFAQYNPAVIFGGQWYRLITSIFIHENIIHLGGNLLFFVIFSLRLEELKGWKVVFIVFMISGLVGNLLTILVFWEAGIVSLGASGAVNGVFIANLVTMRKTYDRGALTMLAFLVIFASFTISGSSSTNAIAHIGGLIGGAASMLFIEKFEKRYGRVFSTR